MTQDLRTRERRAMRRWTAFIVGLLVMQVALCVVGVAIATRGGRGGGTEIVPDYYQKALHWDELHGSGSGGGGGEKAP